MRSFVRLQSVAPGFTSEHVLTMQIAATDPKYRDEKALANLYREIENRVVHLPGVIAEGEVSVLPLTGSVGWGGINVEGYTPPPGQELQVDLRVASADYFRAMEIPLRAGRFFSEHDTADLPGVVIIDERFAKRFWPNGDAVGKHLWFDPKKSITIVGVVGAVKQYGLETEGKIAMYFAREQRGTEWHVPGGANVVRCRWVAGRDRQRNSRCRTDYGGLRNSEHAGPLVRLTGAAAVFQHDAGGVCGVRDVARGRGTLRRDVVFGDAEYSRYRRTDGAGRAARGYSRAGAAAGHGIGGDRHRGRACGSICVDAGDGEFAVRSEHDGCGHVQRGAGIVGGGGVRRYRDTGLAYDPGGPGGGAAGRIAVRVV